MPDKGAIVVSRFDFTGDGMNIPYNSLRAAKARRAEKESWKFKIAL